jgi:hypothetical protein
MKNTFLISATNNIDGTVNVKLQKLVGVLTPEEQLQQRKLHDSDDTAIIMFVSDSDIKVIKPLSYEEQYLLDVAAMESELFGNE